MKFRFLITILIVSTLISCSSDKVKTVDESNTTPPVTNNDNNSVQTGYEYSLKCGTADNEVTTTTATLLIGGSEADAAGEIEATEWLLNHALNGDYLVIRVGGTGSQASWMCDNFASLLGSAAELSIDTVEAANNDAVETYIKNAEIIFISGGDQTEYVELWKDTKVSNALNEHLVIHKKPIAGTSAGLAILGQSYYAPANLGVLSAEILDNPFHDNADSIAHDDFLSHPQLTNTITDSHLDRVTTEGDLTETRHGRTFGFLARVVADKGLTNVKAIGIEEATLIALDELGKAKIFGEGAAYFMSPSAEPEQIESDKPLVWDQNNAAVSVYKIHGSATGNGEFDFTTWSGIGGEQRYWYTTGGYEGFNCKTGC